MSEENKPAVKPAVPVLACGHEDSFEHSFVEGLADVINMCMQTGTPIIEPCMEYTRQVLTYFYIQIPTYDEVQQIILSHKLNDNKSKEVN